jgi:hypothetical protein
VDQTSRIFAAAAGQSQLFATTKFANMLLDPVTTNGIAVYGNTVVVVGDVNTSSMGLTANLCYSTDGGTTFISKSINPPNSVFPYSFSSVTVNTATGQFVALAGNVVLTSTDGNIWNQISTLGVNGTTIFYFPSGPYQYVVADTTSTNIQTSSDAITWTTRSALPNNLSNGFITFGNSFFIVGGNGFLRRTADFITYTTPTINELTGGLTEANFIFNGGIYKGTTFIVSATTAGIDCVFKSTNVGVNFSLGNVDAAYYENVNNGMLVNTPDSRSQTAGTDTDGSVVANPNRGDALSFSGTTYSLRTRQNAFITTTTGSLSTTGLSAVGTTVYDSFARTTTNLGLGPVSLRYISGTWYISYVSTTNGTNSVNVLAPSFNVNVINAYVASGASITGYPFMLNNTFIVLFPNATAVTGGTEYNGSTIYYTTDLITWTQVASLPAAFNASSATPGFAASYRLALLRGEYGAGGYSFILNYADNATRRYMVGTALTAFTANIARTTPDFYSTVKGSANDGTGAAGWVGYVASNAQVSSTWRANIYLSNNFVSAPAVPSTYQLVGLDGTRVLINNVTDVAHINSQFRVYCQFNNLLGVLSYGVLSVTTAGVVSQTINSALSNVKVLGRANSTLYVMSLTTGQVFSTTDGTTYTLRFTWDQPFLGNPVYEDTAGFAYTSGRLLTTADGVGGNTNWFRSIDGVTWTKTEVTSPNASTLAVRNVYPNKYALATSGNYVAIQQGFSEFSSGRLSVATSGSLSNMPYKRLVPYAVPSFNASPVFYNSTLSQYCAISAYYGASVTSTDGLSWSLNSGSFDVNTSTVWSILGTGDDYVRYAYATPAKIFYTFSSTGSGLYYAADSSTPTTYSLFSFPTIGTSYTANQISKIAFDGTTYMIVYYNAGTLNSFTSSNGATWSAAGNGTLTFSAPFIISSVTGSFLVYDGGGTGAFTSNTGSTWTSSINFNFTVAPFGVSSSTTRQAAYGNSTYVMVGYVRGNVGPTNRYYRRVSTSSNGTTWTNTYAPTAFDEFFNWVTFTNLGSGFFIAAGTNSTGASDILYSNTTGSTWTSATISGTLTQTIYQIIDGGASASPRFVALTNSTEVLTSNDGINWTVVTFPNTVNSDYEFGIKSSGGVSFLNGRWIISIDDGAFGNFQLKNAILTSG